MVVSLLTRYVLSKRDLEVRRASAVRLTTSCNSYGRRTKEGKLSAFFSIEVLNTLFANHNYERSRYKKRLQIFEFEITTRK